MYVDFSSPSGSWENNIGVAYGDILLLIRTGVYDFRFRCMFWKGELLLRYPFLTCFHYPARSLVDQHSIFEDFHPVQLFRHGFVGQDRYAAMLGTLDDSRHSVQLKSSQHANRPCPAFSALYQRCLHNISIARLV